MEKTTVRRLCDADSGRETAVPLDNVDPTPEQPGVYALYTDDGIVYYGVARRGDTVRSRLAAHLQGQHAPAGGAAKLFNFKVTHFPMSRALLEEHKRSRWRLPPYNDLL